MKECKIEKTKSKVIRLNEETVYFMEEYKKIKGPVFTEILSDNQIINAAFRDAIDNVIKKD